jgi:PAS domain-containing protein
VVDAIAFFLQPDHQRATPRFLDCPPEEIGERLRALRRDREEETETRSIFDLLATIEAVLRIDYQSRVNHRSKDVLSRAFRTLYQRKQERVLFDEDLLELWTKHHPELKRYISELRAALKFRHWLAHGRYWQRPTNSRFDYASIYDLANDISNFPLHRG